MELKTKTKKLTKIIICGREKKGYVSEKINYCIKVKYCIN